MNCNTKCSGNCVHNDGCSHETGHCERGCKSGWMNDKCDKECPDGKYGQGCLHHCGQCTTSCSKISGECDICNKGWKGKMCNIPATAPQQGNIRTVNVVVPVIVVVIIIVLIVLLIAIFCVWKRTQKEGYNVDENHTEMNPIFKERSPSNADNNAPDTVALLTTSAKTAEIDLDEGKVTLDNDNGIANPVMTIEDEKGGVYTGDDDFKSEPFGEKSNVQDETLTTAVEAEKADGQADKEKDTNEIQSKQGNNENEKNRTFEEETNKKEEVKEEDDSEKSDIDRKSSSSSGSSSSSSNEDEAKPPDTSKEDRPLSDIHGTTTGKDGVLHTPI